MSRTVRAVVSLIVPANKAKPSPAIGQALGSLGINMMGFCKEFNEKSEAFVDDIPCRVRLEAFTDGSFDFKVRSPRTSWLLLKAAGLPKGAANPGHETVGSVHCKQIYEIAKIKLLDDAGNSIHDMEGMCRSIAGSCLSMGLTIDCSREENHDQYSGPG